MDIFWFESVPCWDIFWFKVMLKNQSWLRMSERTERVYTVIIQNYGDLEMWKIAVIILKEKWAASWQNQRNDISAHRRLRSAWASIQSDQSLRYPYEETLGPLLPIECTAIRRYTEGYIVFVFPFVRWYVHLFVRLFLIPSCSWNYFKVLC